MTKDQFEESLFEDLAWRKKEISDLVMLYETVENQVLLKSLILLLYSHWEGYVKRSCKLYLKYVSEKKIRLAELTYNYRAIILKKQISKSIENTHAITMSNELKFLDKYEERIGQIFKLYVDIDVDNEKSIVDTHSNLNPEIFRNILNVVGLNYYSAFALREKYIDNYLLLSRNTIGHGSILNEDLLEGFKLKIENIKVLKTYIFTLQDILVEDLLVFVDQSFYLLDNKKDRESYIETREGALERRISNLEAIE